MKLIKNLNKKIFFIFIISLLFSHIFLIKSFAQENFKLDEVVISSNEFNKKNGKTFEEIEVTNQVIKKTSFSPKINIEDELKTLPVLVRQSTGINSVTSVILDLSLDSSQTAISIEGVPIPDPAKLGVNLSLIPNFAFNSIEIESPFYATLTNDTIFVPTSGGRIHFKSENKKNLKSLNSKFFFDSIATTQIASNFVNQKEKKQTQISIDFNTTKGSYPFIHPITKQKLKRENNASTAIKTFLSYKNNFNDKFDYQFFYALSALARTNPGSLEFPSRDQEKDELHVLGLKSNFKLFNLKLSTTYSKVENNFSIDNKTKAFSFGTFEQIQSKKIYFKSFSFYLNLDHTHERLNDGTGAYKQDLAGLTIGSDYKLKNEGDHVFLLFRGDKHSSFKENFSAQTTYEKFFSPNFSTSFSQGFFTTYPAIMAVHGYDASFVKVLPNLNLLPQKNLLTELNFTHSLDATKTRFKIFYSKIYNRTQYETLNLQEAQYQNIPRSHIYGFNFLNSYNFYVKSINFNFINSISLLKSKDFSIHQEFPYKPNLLFKSSLSALLFKNSKGSFSHGFDFEQISSRKVSLQNSKTLSPYGIVNLFLNYEHTHYGDFLFSIKNLLNEYGFVSDGFPIFGRVFTLEYKKFFNL
jgi:outer membrane cobalamin receptor